MGQLPATGVTVLDANNKFTPHWRRYFQTLDSILTLFETTDTSQLVEQIDAVKADIAELRASSVLQAQFAAEQGAAKTRFDALADQLGYLGDEVKTSTQVSTEARTELYGEREQRTREINSLVAKTNTSNASIVSLSEVVATNQAATATQFSSVQTELDGNSASITDLSTSVDGISATRTISVNSDNAIDGYIQISGEGGVSDFTVVADSFKVFHPNSGEPIPILSTELDDDENPVVQFNGTVEAENLVGTTITGININGSVITGALFQSPGGGITIDGRDEDNLSITLQASEE